jgi:hypothetical protein
MPYPSAYEAPPLDSAKRRALGTQYLVLRCLAWVATISVWKHEIEFGCEQVNHGFEVAD